ncbi:hypothetical protein BDZ91DRAFT_660799 [Kalaharituber pfeilii]|nr:hypothetical protein BDZ91DRAFT_660799 [Kalaharituber pfeilii]
MSQEVGGYKVEPSAEADHPPHQGHHPHHQAHPQHPPPPHHQQPQHPRPGIHQNQPSSSFPSPHQPPQHQSPYAQASNIPGSQHPGHHHQQDPIYFHPTAPYGTPGGNPPPYQSQAPPKGTDLMAHNMNRPYPPMYHTPQSNSPASVASPTGPDPRSVYSTPPMTQQMYGYPQSYASIPAPPTYGAPQHQQHSMTSQPLLMSQAPGQSISPPHQQQHLPHSHPSITNPSPRPLAKTNIAHRASPATSNNNANSGNSSGSGTVNPNAAPGPIPATTPLVVRQDNNGVQWIAFEYSRDRVKMEYTIRCDVESVNVDQLSHDFKTENCVYPRACCPKDQYRGNRLVYETECNTVGWALAELNPCLRGKRGLIQRAVDSWRNSNQDPKLRSRRVRRMAKLNSRKNAAAQQTQVGAGSSVHNAVSNTTNTSVGLGLKGALLGDGSGQALQTHHHHHASGSNYAPVGSMPSTGTSRSTSGHISPAVGGEDFNANGHHHHHHHQGPPTNGNDLRPGRVFHGYPTYPPEPTTAVATSAPAANADSAANDSKSLFGDIPDSKRRKFILVDDPHRGSRVRVRVMLDQVQMQEIPDSYRKSNSVYPRSYTPDNPPLDKDGDDTIHASEITIPLLDGSHLPVSAPPPNPGKRRKERQLNELGYRMSWSQSRVFAGRTMFLQRALDAYRNKMRSSMMATGQDVTVSAPHLETRAGKRRWLERGRRSTSSSSAAVAAVTVSATGAAK